MQAIDPERVSEEYERDGVVHLRALFTPEQVAAIRAELDRYVRDDLPRKPAEARTLEADEKTVRNLWRLEQHHPMLIEMLARPDIVALAGRLVHGEPVLCGIETFNKPGRIGSGVPYHQDNAYFCQRPPDLLTVWIAMDPVTMENGPVYYIRGSQKGGMLPTKPSGVKGNSIGLAEPPPAPLVKEWCALLEPGDALIHHCVIIHHSAPNTSEHPRLGLLLVYRGAHTQTDPALKATYAVASAMTPPA